MNTGFWKNHILAFWAYSRGELILGHPPLFFSIEPTNRCNLKCVYCPQAYLTGRNIKKGDMDVNFFAMIIKKIAATRPVNQIFLTGNGEPLLHPRLEEFVTLTCRYGLHPSFASNGLLLDPSRFASLADAGSFSLTIDFSSDKERYDKNRVGSNWEKVYQNIGSALRFKEEKNRKDIKVIIKDMSTVFLGDDKSKQSSLLELKGLFAGLPVDRFTQTSFHNWTGNISQKVIPSSDDKRYYTLCSHPWSLMQIDSGGRVVACCRDMASEYVVGEINDQTDIARLWNSQRMIHLRDALVKKRWSDITICRNCDRPWRGGSTGRNRYQMVRNFLIKKRAHI